MLPAVVKLCCGISYPHLRSTAGKRPPALLCQLLPAGLQRTAVAVVSRSLQHHQHSSADTHGSVLEAVGRERDRLEQQGREAMREAVEMLENSEGWTVEISESNGDLISSKVTPEARKVFRLDVVLDASMEEIHELLFVRVEEMQQWNPNIHRIKVLRRVGPETLVTHEVSSQMAGNLIGQRDFLSVRHSRRTDACIYLGGAATWLESCPPQDGYVRAEDGPTCILIRPLKEEPGRSRLTWLLNMDVKGWLPKSIVNQTLPRAQLDFIRHLRRRLSWTTSLG